MDLGATICLSRRPLCERCPLADSCQAYAETSRHTLFPSGDALARFRDERRDSVGKGAGASAERSSSARPTAASEKAGRAVAEDAPRYTGAAASRLKRAERRSPEPFTQTSRYFRGRVVEILRGLAPEESLTMAELGPLVRSDFGEDVPEADRLASRDPARPGTRWSGASPGHGRSAGDRGRGALESTFGLGCPEQLSSGTARDQTATRDRQVRICNAAVASVDTEGSSLDHERATDSIKSAKRRR